MKCKQYLNHPKQKESFIENNRFRFSRFQDPRDLKWYVFCEIKADEFNFSCFNGPFKRKYSATDQIKTWMSDETIDF